MKKMYKVIKNRKTYSKKFLLPNLLTEKHKLDRRYYLVQRAKQYLAGIVLGIILGLLIGCYLIGNPCENAEINAPKALGQMIESKVNNIEVQAQERYCDDPISYIRCSGEKLGKSNEEILTMIRIAKCESGLRPDAINLNSNKTADLGVLQINDVHNKRISRADRLDFKKNIDFGWKLQTEQGGFQAWVCYKKI